MKLTWKVNYSKDALIIVKRLMDEFVCSGDGINIKYDESNREVICVEYIMENEYDPTDILRDIEDYCGFRSE